MTDPGKWTMTTADVARRLGVSPATVQRWAKALEEGGYLKRDAEGVAQWTPELVELVEFVEGVMQASPHKISFADALAVVERVGRIAVESQRGRTYASAIFEASYSVRSAERALRATAEEVREDVREMLETAGASVVREVLSEFADAVAEMGGEVVSAVQELRRAAREAKRAGWWIRLAPLWLWVAGAAALVGMVGISAQVVPMIEGLVRRYPDWSNWRVTLVALWIELQRVWPALLFGGGVVAVVWGDVD